MTEHELQERINRLLNRPSYSHASFEDEGITHVDQIAIIGPPGSGTSTLMKNLQKSFPEHFAVSGGDYQRSLTKAPTSEAEKAILELNARNAADPRNGTDHKTETFLITHHLMYKKLIMDARNAHWICEAGACTFYLDCPPEVCAKRIEDDRHLPKGEGIKYIERRKLYEERFKRMYPGSDIGEAQTCGWNKREPYITVINTHLYNAEATHRRAKQVFQSFRERFVLREPITQ